VAISLTTCNSYLLPLSLDKWHRISLSLSLFCILEIFYLNILLRIAHGKIRGKRNKAIKGDGHQWVHGTSGTKTFQQHSVVLTLQIILQIIICKITQCAQIIIGVWNSLTTKYGSYMLRLFSTSETLRQCSLIITCSNCSRSLLMRFIEFKHF
jgi:hypothetical protein